MINKEKIITSYDFLPGSFWIITHATLGFLLESKFVHPKLGPRKHVEVMPEEILMAVGVNEIDDDYASFIYGEKIVTIFIPCLQWTIYPYPTSIKQV